MYIQNKIERYVRGELNETEEDELWAVFLAYPEWYSYFNTYLNLMALARKGYEVKINSVSR